MLCSRREWIQWCAAAWLGTGVASAGTPTQGRSSRSAAHRLVVAVADKSALGCLPLTIAERLGYFSAEGIALEIREYANEEAALRSVQEGVAQLLSGPYALTVSQRLRGEYLVSFLVQGLAPKIVVGVSQLTMKGFRKARELRGRRVGVTALGSTSHGVVRHALARASLSEQEVRYVAMPNPEAAWAAFQSGELDAISYPDPLITRLEQSGSLRIVVDTRTLLGSEELFGGPCPSACLAAPTAWLASNPELCQATANAMVHALKWLQTAGPSDLNKAVPESYFQGDRAVYLAAFERTRETWAADGLMPEAGPRTVARMLAQLGGEPLLDSGGRAGTHTNQFALKAKARFRA
jgi:NitT/TauT family transport system substrate-binding protein